MIGKPERIIAVAAMAALGLIGLAVREGLERARGTEVILGLEAVDPRSLLSGHYVALGLRALAPLDHPCPPGTVARETPLWVLRPQVRPDPWRWVALAPRIGGAEVRGVADRRAAAARFAGLLVRGDAACLPTPPQMPQATSREVRINLGLDRFYLSQFEAERVQALLARPGPGAVRPAQAIVSIGRDGRARMKGLVVQGRRVEPDWL